MSVRINGQPNITGVMGGVITPSPPPEILYATWNPDDKNVNIGLTNGNLTAAKSTAGNAWISARGLFGKSTGNWYIEFTTGGQSCAFGFATSSANLATFIGGSPNGFCYIPYNNTYQGSGFTSEGSTPWPGNGSFAFAIDIDNKKAWLRNSTKWIGDPVAGTGNSISWTADYILFPAMSAYNGASFSPVTANFGQNEFQFEVPSGFNPGWYEEE